MKVARVFTVNAILFIAIGIGFTLYAPNFLAFFGAQELPGDNALLYWNISAFARMFGAMLLLCGLLIWAVRGLFIEGRELATVRREIVYSLVIGFVVITITALTQQSSIWGSAAGWLVTAFFAILAVIYIFILAKKV
jgi:hypothetical protein